MKIKMKILSGFVLIIAMLIIAGAMSIYEFSRLSNSVRALIDDNYRTIETSKTMVEALEREDSGVLLLLSGHLMQGREILRSADSLFNAAFNVAKNNITEQDEGVYIERIENSYREYVKMWESPIVGTHRENSIDWYFADLHPKFLAIKEKVNELMTLNQNSMYKVSTELKEKAHRALMPGIIAILGSMIFLIIFNFFISKYYVKPIENIIHSLKNHNPASEQFDAGISTDDEFGVLQDEIRNLINKLK